MISMRSQTKYFTLALATLAALFVGSAAMAAGTGAVAGGGVGMGGTSNGAAGMNGSLSGGNNVSGGGVAPMAPGASGIGGSTGGGYNPGVNSTLSGTTGVGVGVPAGTVNPGTGALSTPGINSGNVPLTGTRAPSRR